jgi:hypothetical protein
MRQPSETSVASTGRESSGTSTRQSCGVNEKAPCCTGCWTNIVSTLLLLGIRSLNALLAHSIAVNTGYISSLVLHTWAYKPLVVLDLVIRRK